jgi:hypothetical protein
MFPESQNNANQEDLKSENQFLKMKLMLERGAYFGGSGDSDLPPQVENDFLNRVIEFEKQWENVKCIKLFDKIERPAHFKPVAEVDDQHISQAWDELSAYLNKYSIRLDACSPNISERELYRFTTEELFQYEIEDMNIPGMNTCFIYDEFYPDPVYDNSRMVEEDLLRDIFRKEDLFYEIHYDKAGFSFNGNWCGDWQLFKENINRFKSAFEEIEMTGFSIDHCGVNEAHCTVKGNYSAVAKTGEEKINYLGVFEVGLLQDEMGYWNFKEIRIDGFNPS